MFPIKDTIHSRSFPAVNWLLIIANVAVFVLVEAPLGPRAFAGFVNAYGLVPAELAAGRVESVADLFTSMFLHGGWLHLISNMWALFIFGDNVEDRMGSGRYLVFYLLSGVAAALTQVVVSPDSRLPMVGASGAIAGVLAAYLVLYPRARVITLVFIFFLITFVEIPAVIYLGIWFVSQLFGGLLALGETAAAGGVAVWAHIGGFVFGLVMVRLFAHRPRVYYRTYADEYRPW
jgi:membrane associated rhomboid family serine protease